MTRPSGSKGFKPVALGAERLGNGGGCVDVRRSRWRGVAAVAPVTSLAVLLLVLSPGGARAGGEPPPPPPPPIGAGTIENGDVNGDWQRDVSDAVYLLEHIFLGRPAPVPFLEEVLDPALPVVSNGDVNGDGMLDATDALDLLVWLLLGGDAPVAVTCFEVDLLGGDEGSCGATADGDRPIAWAATGGFDLSVSPDFVATFSGAAPGLRVSHLGLSTIAFEVTGPLTSPVTALITGGTFTFTAANGDELSGVFTGGELLASGEFFLTWTFTGGTGRFEDATGSGRSDGRLSLTTATAGTFTGKNLGWIRY